MGLGGSSGSFVYLVAGAVAVLCLVLAVFRHGGQRRTLIAGAVAAALAAGGVWAVVRAQEHRVRVTLATDMGADAIPFQPGAPVNVVATVTARRSGLLHGEISVSGTDPDAAEHVLCHDPVTRSGATVTERCSLTLPEHGPVELVARWVPSDTTTGAAASGALQLVVVAGT